MRALVMTSLVLRRVRNCPAIIIIIIMAHIYAYGKPGPGGVSVIDIFNFWPTVLSVAPLVQHVVCLSVYVVCRM